MRSFDRTILLSWPNIKTLRVCSCVTRKQDCARKSVQSGALNIFCRHVGPVFGIMLRIDDFNGSEVASGPMRSMAVVST